MEELTSNNSFLIKILYEKCFLFVLLINFTMIPWIPWQYIKRKMLFQLFFTLTRARQKDKHYYFFTIF